MQASGGNLPAGDDRANPGFPVGIQLNTLPRTLGTHACDSMADGSNPYRKVNMWFWWNGKLHTAGYRANPAAGPEGSGCAIPLTQAGTTVEGSFSGTFKASDGSTVAVTNGHFRYIGPPETPSGVPPYLPAMSGSHFTKVTQGNATPGYTFTEDTQLIITDSGDLFAGNHTFAAGQYTAAGSGEGRSANSTFQLPSGGALLTIYVGGSRPSAFEITQGGQTMKAGIRPVMAELVTLVNELIGGSPRTLTAIYSYGCAACSTTNSLTVTGTVNANNPANHFTFISPDGTYNSYGDGSTRYLESGGDRTLGTYYGELTLRANGYVEWRAYNGNGVFPNPTERWTNDPAVIGATCP